MGYHCTTCTCAPPPAEYPPLGRGYVSPGNAQAYAVLCRRCGAPPQHRCIAMSGQRKPTTLHPERQRDGRRS